jgi:hypothetical protein
MLFLVQRNSYPRVFNGATVFMAEMRQIQIKSASGADTRFRNNNSRRPASRWWITTIVCCGWMMESRWDSEKSTARAGQSLL